LYFPQALLEEEKKKIKPPFEQIHTFLEEKLNISLANLTDLEKETEDKHKARVATLSAESLHLTDLIKEVETKCQQPPSEFLQVRLKRTLEAPLTESLESIETEPTKARTAIPFVFMLAKQNVTFNYIKRASSDVLRKRQVHHKMGCHFYHLTTIFPFILSSFPLFSPVVNVTLDGDTAHPSLILSSNPESVTVGGTGLFLPDNPERFEFMHCVLGCEAFDSGNHWWEVKVTRQQKKKIMWAVGVASESVKRKGLFLPCPDEGIWAVGNLMSASPSHLLAFTSPKLHPLILRRNLRKIRVSLNYEGKCVKFFDADTNKVFFIFGSATFSGKKVRPYFWLWRGAKLSC
ncbi:hypothetical protein JD844_013517, partial [Phrynosoma platyrhinos]